jgi:hypothetical protein
MEGYFVTVPIVFSDLDGMYPRVDWGMVRWQKSSGGDSIGIQVEYLDGGVWGLVPDLDLPGNSVGFWSVSDGGEFDISGLDPVVYDTLRLRVLFYRKSPFGSSPEEPVLRWLECGLPVGVGVGEGLVGLDGPYFSVGRNVFRGGLRVRFSIPANRGAVLGIYSVTGRLVKEVRYGVSSISRFVEYMWKGNDNRERRVRSGVYFIKFETGGYKRTMKAILVE